MKLEWLDDLLAVIDNGSLYEAGEKRYLTQPAFSRRIQTIERYVGAELFDRSCKPVQLRDSVLRNEGRIRQIAMALRELSRDLAKGDGMEPMFVLACQHSISTAVAPALIKSLSNHIDTRIKLRSANRDDCYAFLFTGEADVVLMYQTSNELIDSPSDFIESSTVGQDFFIPVVSAERYRETGKSFDGGKLDIVGYPDNVFLGKVFNENIKPQILQSHKLKWIAETGFSPAALQFALEGIGVAWVPRSLALSLLDSGELRDLSDLLPRITLEISALQLKRETRSSDNETWQWIKANRIQLEA